MGRVNIIGAGLSGLAAAIALAKLDVSTNLISIQPSERAQSVMAEGGINGALNTMGEDDKADNHFNDTMKAGCYIADQNAVRGLTNGAPGVLRYLQDIGVAFNLSDGDIALRNFGGQKKKRTAYAKSSTGKIIMSALIDEARKYEASGIINRFPHHEFIKAEIEKETCTGVYIKNTYTGENILLKGPVLAACGGLNGLLPGMTTGTTNNTSDVVSTLFRQGVKLSNLEMVQYHPTTIGIARKRALISEAARGEGGRLFTNRGGERWYFMEEKYPELKNLMPRDVVSREEYFVMNDPACDGKVYLDMTHLKTEVWKNRLPDLRAQVIHYLGIDPAKDYLQVSPGIHYFMGGIDVGADHRSNIDGLYACGECCSLYHGANRLGGNSMLGAVYGGQKAAETIAETERDWIENTAEDSEHPDTDLTAVSEDVGYEFASRLGKLIAGSMGIVRDEEGLKNGLRLLEKLKAEAGNMRQKNRVMLAEAMIRSALFRTESRGAHYRSDYPKTDDLQRKMTYSVLKDNKVEVFYDEII